MKTFKKIIIVILIALISLEFAIYTYSVYIVWDMFHKRHQKWDDNYYTFNIIMQPYENHYKSTVSQEWRKNFGLNKPKKPILLLGDSIIYGWLLEDKDTFSYKLSEYTNRPVYNKSINGSSLSHAVLYVQNPDLYNEVKEPEYCIIDFQSLINIPRLYQYVWFLYEKCMYPRFEIKDGKLVRADQIRWYSGSYIYKLIRNLQIIPMQKGKLSEENMDLAFKHIETINNELKKHWKNTKLIVIFYIQGKEPVEFDNRLKERLKNIGLTVVDTKELTGVYLNGEYQVSENDPHLNGKAWDLVVPKLAEKLNL